MLTGPRLAGLARSLAHARSSSTYSARVTERGTVPAASLSRDSVLMAPASEKAEYRLDTTTCSISEPLNPVVAAPSASRSNDVLSFPRFSRWI